MLIGITAEWNPFHSGHEYILRTAKDTCGAPIVACMSGAFVQRGEPAIFDKWTRARQAVLCGADAVYELPVLCALQSADLFSEAAAGMLAALGCTHLLCGAESLTVDELIEAADYAASDAFENAFHEALSFDIPYAKAMTKAMAEYSETLAKELTRPNNLLAFRYACAIRNLSLPMKMIVVPRDDSHPASATKARDALRRTGTYDFLPDTIREETEALMRNEHFVSQSRYEDACLLASRLVDSEALTRSGLFKEGLENKWYKEMEACSYTKALDHIKSKRYLMSRLKRIGAQLLLEPRGNPSPFSCRHTPLYARLLALRKSKSAAVSASTLPVIHSVARGLRNLTEEGRAMLMMDILAGDIQAWCMESETYRRAREDFYHSPEII